MTQHTLTVDEESHHLRLDVFLTKSLPDVPSRTFVKHLIDNGGVRVNGKAVKAHQKVASGESVTVEIPDTETPCATIGPENIPLDIFYEDDFLLVINKPAGLLVHPTATETTGTLVNALLYYTKNLSDVNAPERPGIVHRLDRETSGLLCTAKDNRTHIRLARQFEKHRVYKHYTALVKGSLEHEEGIVDVSLGRHPVHWDKKAPVDEGLGRKAKTLYRVHTRFGSKATLVALFPESGRTHQLRVHMAHLGHPVLGDGKYGTRRSFPRLALHAQGLGFTHPQTGHYLEFNTPPPPELLAPPGLR